MTKDEFLEELRRRGYKAEMEDGTVMVFDEKKNRFKEVAKIAKEVGIHGGYGWRGKRE